LGFYKARFVEVFVVFQLLRRFLLVLSVGECLGSTW